MIYLASPYTSIDPDVQGERFEAAVDATVSLIKQGQMVYSPIVSSHFLHLYGLPGDWEFWRKQDERHISRCDMLVVLTIDGWEQSKGIDAEIRLAHQFGKPIVCWDGQEPFATAVRHASELTAMRRSIKTKLDNQAVVC